jgi:hypothetical protein
MMQPPSLRAPKRPPARATVIVQKKTHDWPPALDGGNQRGLIRQTQIVAKPDESRRVIIGQFGHEGILREGRSG